VFSFLNKKTFVSTSFFEFAKRLFWNGVEVSPFPISALGASLHRYHIFVATLLEAEVKGWIPVVEPWVAISSLIARVRSVPSRYRKTIESRAKPSDLVMRITRGTVAAGQALTSLARDFGHQFTLTDAIGMNILENVVVEEFAKSNPANYDKDSKHHLGWLAEHLVIILTGVSDDKIALGMETIYALPILSVYGQVEETYMELSARARKLSLTGGD
jgi:hypothetical protein